MAGQKQVTVTISPAGNVHMDAEGFQGKGCEEVTQQMVLLLGGGAAQTDRKPEWHAPPVSTAATNRRTF